ncbi:hypothetical protein WH95_08315 [Kiloniella litopenaei]|uniref:Uncharacterized protein n=1 Tax=Kiloniella litopenaei TaxID=1549748 RepID=A0A0M2RAQ5_9PROT|nr:hypothetical protein WH95_08315 [Kiloniella litopenaei]
MLASGFMTVKDATRFYAPSKAIVVCIVHMAQSLVRQFSKETHIALDFYSDMYVHGRSYFVYLFQKKASPDFVVKLFMLINLSKY